MQQLLLICQDMFNDIRNAIREEALSDGKTREGFIKVSFYACNEEALYEFTSSLDPKLDINTNVISGVETYNVKRRTECSPKDADANDGSVYALKNYFEATVRVGGAGDRNRELCLLAQKSIEKFLAEQNLNCSVTLD